MPGVISPSITQDQYKLRRPTDNSTPRQTKSRITKLPCEILCRYVDDVADPEFVEGLELFGFGIKVYLSFSKSEREIPESLRIFLKSPTPTFSPL